MRRLFAIGIMALVVASGVSSASGAAGVSDGWVIRDLGTLGGPTSWAYDINTAGRIVGRAAVDPAIRFHAFLWQDGKMRDLGTLGGQESEARGLNSTGVVVGCADTPKKNGIGLAITHAFLWKNGAMRDLGTLGGPSSCANDVNDRGQIVGWADTAGGRQHAVIWQNGRIRDLGTLKGGFAEANALNARGEIVGWSGSADVGHAVLWRNGRLIDLGTLGGPASAATGINDRAQVVGWANTSSSHLEERDTLKVFNSRAFAWERGRLWPLPRPRVDTTFGYHSIAWGINERGQIVGGDNRSALAWQRGTVRRVGGQEDLAELYAVNDRGVAVGHASEHAIRLQEIGT